MSDIHTNTPRSRGDSDSAHMSPVTPAEDARTILITACLGGPFLPASSSRL